MGGPVAGRQQHLGRAEYSTEGDAGLPVSLLQRYTSTGLAARVPGGKFSQSGRDGAAGTGSTAAAAAAASELLYEPRPEVQGHMRRAPGWSLPPNTVETSRKWARMAAQAMLQ